MKYAGSDTRCCEGVPFTMVDNNLLTDIEGLRVGNVQDDQIVSGVTAILFDCDTVASGTIRGGAPGTRDTDLLRPEMSVQGVDAVVLSGGSQFGLDAAGGVVAWLRAQGIGLPIANQHIPIAVQAITFDLQNGGNKDWQQEPVYWHMGWQAAKQAAGGLFKLGSVGGGYGATTANFKGGLGSASAMTSRGLRVAALVVVNAVGSATVGNGPWFWAAPVERNGEFGAYGAPSQLTADALQLTVKKGVPTSTTIALVVTDAVLTKSQAHRLATMADDGLARAVRPSHAPMDGDTVFAVATLDKTLCDPTWDLTELGALAADCLSRAIARGVYHAVVPAYSYSGPPAFSDVHKVSWEI